jgi:hypothetical protein
LLDLADADARKDLLARCSIASHELTGSAWYIESPQSAQPLLSGAPKAGRSFYTSLGHLDSSKSRHIPLFAPAELFTLPGWVPNSQAYRYRPTAYVSAWQNATFQSHLLGGLSWALAGNSTRAYGVGLVGNTTTTSSDSRTSTSAPASSGAPSSTSKSAGPSSSAAAPPSTSSRSAGEAAIRTGQDAGTLKKFGLAGLVGVAVTAIAGALGG